MTNAFRQWPSEHAGGNSYPHRVAISSLGGFQDEITFGENPLTRPRQETEHAERGIPGETRHAIPVLVAYRQEAR